MSQSERLYWIHAQIMDDRYPNADKVSRYFEVSKRTGQSDMAYLRDRLNAPIKTDRKRDGWYYTDKTYMLPFLALSEKEAEGLRRTLLAAEVYLGPIEAHSVRILYNRLIPYLPKEQDERIESIGGMIYLMPEAEIAPALLDAGRRALRNRQKIWIRYYSPRKDEISERLVRPYHLFFHLGEPHLICWCEKANEIRQFMLSRVRAWQLQEEEHAFERDANFDIDTYLKQGLGVQHGTEVQTVRVLFSAYQARWIRERRYHNSQQNEYQADGSLLVTMRVSGMPEVARWLLSYGSDVEVLEPDELKQILRDHVKKLAQIYDITAE